MLYLIKIVILLCYPWLLNLWNIIITLLQFCSFSQVRIHSSLLVKCVSRILCSMGIAQLTQSNEFIARRLVAFSLYVLTTISMFDAFPNKSSLKIVLFIFQRTKEKNCKTFEDANLRNIANLKPWKQYLSGFLACLHFANLALGVLHFFTSAAG